MKEVTKTITEARNVTMYVADDGTEFRDKRSCQQHEQELLEDGLNNSPDVIENTDAEGCAPFDGLDYNGDHSFRWFKPLNIKGVDLLNKVFSFEYKKLDETVVGKWIYVETDSWDEAWYGFLQDSLDYAEEMKRRFEDFDEEKGNAQIRGSKMDR